MEENSEVCNIARIAKIAVIGAGTMGHGIAQVAAQFGKYEVNLCDTSRELVEAAMDLVRNSLQQFARNGKITGQELGMTLERIHPTSDLEDAIAGADLVIEAIDENVESKKKLLGEISQKACAHTIIATNTSSIPIAELSSAVRKPENFCGLHFFNPPQLLELVEVVKGDRTSNETVRTILDVAHNMKREAVVLKKDCPGFIVNRILLPALNEAASLYFSGVAERDDIDKAIKMGLKWPMGPLRLMDLIGVDTVVAISEVLERELGEEFSSDLNLRQMVREGKLGRKTGKGFYNWPLE